MRDYGRQALITVVAGIAYFALAYLTVGYSFGAAPGLDWLQAAFGHLAGARIWSHSVHAVALLVAAIPSAVLLGILGPPHVLGLAAITGALVSAASFVPSFLHPEVRPHLDTVFYVEAGIDSLKMVLILVVLSWLVGKLPPNIAFEPPGRRAAGAAGEIAPTARSQRRRAAAQRGS